MPRVRRAIRAKFANWRDVTKLRLYDTARSLTDSLFHTYRSQIQCPSCDTYDSFWLCSNGGGRGLDPVLRRYKHYCPIGNSTYTLKGHRHKGKVLTVGVPDMLMNFLMPILERESTGRGRIAALAKRRLVACHSALVKLKKSGRKVDAGNLALRLEALEEVHGRAASAQLGSMDGEDDEDRASNVYVEIDNSTRRAARKDSTDSVEDSALLTALQAGLLLGHPRWEPRPTGSIVPEDRDSQRQVEQSATATQFSVSRQQSESHPTVTEDSDDWESVHTPSVTDDDADSRMQTLAVEPSHARISYIDAGGLALDDWSTLLERMSSNDDRLDVCIIANVNTNAILNSLSGTRLSSHIAALSPLCTQGDATTRAPGMLLLTPPQYRSHLMVFSITPYTCTFRVHLRSIHAVYLPPKMGALDQHNLFTSFFKLPGGLRPDVILGDVNVAINQAEDTQTSLPRTRSQRRTSGAFHSNKTVGRAKVALGVLGEYGLHHLQNDDGQQSDGQDSLPPHFCTEDRRQNCTLYAFVSTQDTSAVQTRPAYGQWRMTGSEQDMAGMILDIM